MLAKVSVVLPDFETTINNVLLKFIFLLIYVIFNYLNYQEIKMFFIFVFQREIKSLCSKNRASHSYNNTVLNFLYLFDRIFKVKFITLI